MENFLVLTPRYFQKVGRGEEIFYYTEKCLPIMMKIQAKWGAGEKFFPIRPGR